MAEETKVEGGLLHFNGIDVESGQYDRPPMSSEELWKIVQGEATPDNLAELRFKSEHPEQFAIEEGRNPKNLKETGWGVIFASDAEPAVKEALSELLNWRQKLVGDELFRIYEGPDGLQEGESKTKFLARHGAGPGPVKPDKVPYYLLIVGSPDRIPYRFQTQLDVQYAVGRIHFDTLDEYANYAQSVVTAESGQVKLPRTGAFFGVANTDDQATQLSAKHLVDPLFQKFSGEDAYKRWELSSFMKEQATRGQLEALLGGEQTPAFLFSASHGASFPMGNSLQRTHNGALICQDWPGPREWRGALPEEFYFAGDHLGSDKNLLGLIAFFFACYGGGTPRMDEFSAQAFRDSRREIAPNNFVAHLPNKMLSQPKGGALAVVGHVERAWGYSFVWPKAGQQTTVFESTLKRLLEGHPIGSAVEYFNERYAELATVLSDELENIKYGGKENPYEMVGMWTANNDARGYAIIGDPAVRLPVAGEEEASSDRPVIEVQFTAPPAQESGAPASPAAV
ncbi:MAG: C25 family cysteine peptidase, partial [Chloroflexota bacterium]